MGVFWVTQDFERTNSQGRKVTERLIIDTPLDGDQNAVLAKALEDRVLPGEQLTVRTEAGGRGVVLRREATSIPANRILQLRPYGLELVEAAAVRVSDASAMKQPPL